MTIDICPLCGASIMPVFRGDKWSWCDSCCAEITIDDPGATEEKRDFTKLEEDDSE